MATLGIPWRSLFQFSSPSMLSNLGERKRLIEKNTRQSSLWPNASFQLRVLEVLKGNSFLYQLPN